LRGIGSALETVASLALMCDPRDLGQTLGDGGSEGTPAGRDPHAGRTGGVAPTVFLFDSIPGGVGLAERIFERAPELLGRAHALVLRCPCALGCPACVGPAEEGARKELALRLIEAFQLGSHGTVH
jgi:DEAD/DEAH box helicase domain-containing protein